MSLFSKIKLRAPRLNKFDLSHERKFSLNMGNLVPIYVQDIVPGDKFRVRSEVMMRLAPMLAPVMHRVNVFTHYFFVPNRLIWDEWEDFITGGRLGTSTPVAPRLEISTALAATGIFNQGTLWDYLGLPVIPDTTTVTDGFQVSALPFRAYLNIFNEYYRDQNLLAEIPFLKTGGTMSNPETAILAATRQRCWEKDYFTSALPWAQRGGDVLLPLEGTGYVNYLDTSEVYRSDGNAPFNTNPLTSDTDGLLYVPNSLGQTEGRIENIDEVVMDASQITINDLRRSVKLQEWLEKNARGGARYIEQILSHFGVQSSDARLQRPEYLGGGKSPVVISEVLSTFQSDGMDDIPQGNMAGHGISVGNTNGFKRRFEEHGYVIGIMSVLPRTAYQQGVPRHYSRFDKFDYFWPEFANIGEQQILQKEIYAPGTGFPGTADAGFGYQSRYAEYKYGQSTVHGSFRDSLAYWHMGRIFSAPPALNNSFVTSDPTKRIFAVDDPAVESLYCQLYNNVSALRPMPYFGTPTL